MSPDIFKKILEDNKELSSLPQVIVEVINIANDPDSSISSLAGVIKKDPALTAKLLRIVNSPYYCPAREITTIDQAVVTVGLRTVTSVALAASIYDKFKSMGRSIDRIRFWRHSLEVALTSRHIAREAGYEPAEEAFAAGLLHDIGSLVLEASFPDEFAKNCRLAESGVRLTSVEQRTWGTNHARVGQFLLTQWKLPESICEAVGNHHVVYAEGEMSPEHKLNQIVNLANHISKFRFREVPQPDKEEFGNKRILTENLGLSLDVLGDVEQNSISEVANESSYLDVEIGSIEDILRDANHLLFKQYLIAEQLLHENMQMQQHLSDTATGNMQPIRELVKSFSQFIFDVNEIIINQTHTLQPASSGKADNIKEISDRPVVLINESVDTISVILKELRRLCDLQSGCDHKVIKDAKDQIRLRIKRLHKGKVTATV
ncbi:MAG: hypothetical protein DRP46_10530 [Candidatus Zixiibacteriota bacterium]|nr:MAG: hypothetical protein DRP46_10530 [candidate division Zixibacteria bacterium]